MLHKDEFFLFMHCISVPVNFLFTAFTQLKYKNTVSIFKSFSPPLIRLQKRKKLTLFSIFNLIQGWQESNSRRGALETPALPLSYSPIIIVQGVRGSNPRQRFRRPMCYHYTNPPLFVNPISLVLYWDTIYLRSFIMIICTFKSSLTSLHKLRFTTHQPIRLIESR